MRISLIRGGVAVAALALASIPSLASAAAVQAVVTGVSTSFPCPSFCGGAGARFFGDAGGGVGFTTSHTAVNNIDGIAQAQADLNGLVELPVLRAQAFGLPNAGATAQAAGMQGFYYDGSGSGTYQLDIALSGIVNNPSVVPGRQDGSLTANVFIFRDNDPSTDTPYSNSYGSFLFEIIPSSSDLEVLTDAGLLQIAPDNVQHTVSTSLSVSGLNPGDLIYVWAQVQASGLRGGSGDGYDTMTMQFQNASGLSHSPVPIPGAFALFTPAALLLSARIRRRKT
jgi:hypothetical protein